MIGMFKEAIEMFDRYLEINTTNDHAYYNKGTKFNNF